MSKKLTALSILTVLLLPIIVWAVNFPALNPGFPFAIQDIIDNIFNFIWMMFAAFAVIMFVVAGIIFLSSRGEPAKVEQTRQFVIWGVIGVIVALLSVSIPWIISFALGV